MAELKLDNVSRHFFGVQAVKDLTMSIAAEVLKRRSREIMARC